MNNRIINKHAGQAMIVVLMVMVIVTLLLAQVVMMNITSISLAGEFSDGSLLYSKAEGYLENAAIRFLRDISYSGETLQDGDISCTIEVIDLGGGLTDLVSTCSENGRTKIAAMNVSLAAGRFTFSQIAER